MARLPTVGGDDDTWGNVLNDFLNQEHNPDGTLKNVVRPTDSRLTDSRTPLAHKDSHKTGGSDALSASDIGAASTTDLSSKADDSAVVHLAGSETVTGAKDFTGGATINSTNIVVTSDSRLTDSRTPTDGSVTDTKIASGGLSPSKVTGTAVVNTDARLSDNRTPTDGSVTDAKITSGGLSPSSIAGGVPADATYPSTALVRYVDYINGNDSNDGLTSKHAFKTIAAAYSNLKTVFTATYTHTGPATKGVGQIHLLPGDHDVGAGVLFNTAYPVELIGTKSGANNHLPTNSASRIVSTSATATYLVKMGDSSIGHGGVFRNLSFVVDPAVNSALTKCLYISGMDEVVVKDNSFDPSDNSTELDTCTAIYVDAPADDCAWGRFTTNHIARMQTMYFAAGHNYNRMTIADNVSFYGGGSTHLVPHYDIVGDVECSTFEHNNCESTAATGATAFRIRTGGYSNWNLFIGNSGEGILDTNPFYWFEANRASNIVIGGHTTCKTIGGTDGNGIWARIDDGTGNPNLIIGEYDLVGTVGLANRIVDNHISANLANKTQVWSTSMGGMPVTYKAGAGAQTIADTDFAKVPPNGSMAIGCNTTTGAVAIWTRANGLWSSQTIASFVPLAGGTMSGELVVPDLKVTGLTGSVQPLRLVGATATGAPTTGAHLATDVVVTQDGHVFVCTVAGTPGTWVDAGVAAGAGVVLQSGSTMTGDLSTTGLVISDVDGTGVESLAAQTTPPSAATAAHASLFARARAGREEIAAIAATGAARSLFGLPLDRTWSLGSVSASGSIRTAGCGAGWSANDGTPTSISASKYMGPMLNIASGTGAGSKADLTAGNPFQVTRGAASDAYAGFFARARVFYVDASYDSGGASTGSRIWALCLYGASMSTLLGADRGGAQDIAGFVRAHVNGGATDANWQFVTCDGGATPTVINTAIPFVPGAAGTGHVYELMIWCPAGGAAVYWRVDDLTAGTSAEGSSSTHLPTAAILLNPVSGLITIDAVARNMRFSEIYLETDKG